MVHALIAVSVIVILGFVLELVRKAPNIVTDSGDLELRYHPLVTWGGFSLGLAGCLMFIGVALFVPPKNAGEVIGLIVALLLFAWAGGFYFVKRRARVLVNDEGIVATYAFGQERKMRWEEVRKVTYSNMTGNYILRSTTEKIGVFGFSIGIKDFAAILQQNVPEEYRRKAQGYLDNMHS